MKRKDIQIRDPFILPAKKEGLYYLYGTTDKNPWNSEGVGFDVYKSTDLENWDGPFPAFRPGREFWGTHDFWAPEVHSYGGLYYMFATFTSPGSFRGTQVLKSNTPEGPFHPLRNKAITPERWHCLDGTLYVDKEQNPWLIFCREWVQVNDGEIHALRMSHDLRHGLGDPIKLFSASEALWPKKIPRRDGSSLCDARVTDGPYLHRNSRGTLLLLWSSLGESGYCLGSAWSRSGTITGPWVQNETPILSSDGGHGMLFRSFENRLYLTYHSPNSTPNERFHYGEVTESDSTLIMIDRKEADL